MISILGAGAIGQLLAHKLTEASIDCQLIVRDSQRYRADAWKLEHQEHQTYHEISAKTVDDCGELRHLWICVKSHQLEAALQSIQAAITPDTTVVLFQNGMGHDTLAKKYVNPEQLYFASNTHGAFKSERQTVVYAGEGAITFGHLDHQPRPDWLSPKLLSALSGSWHPDIHAVLWQKLLINSVVNPLTAIYQCKNGELLDEDKKPRVLALIDENKRLAKALGLTVAGSTKETTLEVIQATAKNQSSMLQDVLNQQTTEINAINGYLLDQAARLGVQVPHHWRLWSDFHIAYPPRRAIAQEKAKSLDSLAYQVTQQHGTEPPFSGSYNLHHEQGMYHCVCCDAPLFRDSSKFDSGCGWPSFDQAQDNKAIAYKLDTSHGMTRTEILCAQCGSHLGHVFEDGPTDTGQRFCVNSVSLNFEQENS